MTEAVIQFQCNLRPPGDEAAHAAAARTLGTLLEQARALGIVGRDPGRNPRYDGLAFGNVSTGTGAEAGFWVSATQTADLAVLEPDMAVRVEAWSIDANRVDARGRRMPSSETLSHAAIFEARGSRPTTVVHGHAPRLWALADALELPVTDPAAANGTIAIARAVRALAIDEAGLIVMGGHRDGVLAYADSGPRAIAAIRDALEAAAQHQTLPGSLQ